MIVALLEIEWVWKQFKLVLERAARSVEGLYLGDDDKGVGPQGKAVGEPQSGPHDSLESNAWEEPRVESNGAEAALPYAREEPEVKSNGAAAAPPNARKEPGVES